jgi:hypothetical protein
MSAQIMRQRHTHTNHTHDECKFKESTGRNHPNLGKAPAKKQRNAKTNAVSELGLRSGLGSGLWSGLRREYRIAVVGVGEIESNVLLLVRARGIPPAWSQVAEK